MVSSEAAHPAPANRGAASVADERTRPRRSVQHRPARNPCERRRCAGSSTARAHRENPANCHRRALSAAPRTDTDSPSGERAIQRPAAGDPGLPCDGQNATRTGALSRPRCSAARRQTSPAMRTRPTDSASSPRASVHMQTSGPRGWVRVQREVGPVEVVVRPTNDADITPALPTATRSLGHQNPSMSPEPSPGGPRLSGRSKGRIRFVVVRSGCPLRRLSPG